ncbi:MAG: peptide ABC transporter permease, partial [Candidatus Margulisbacteria bacterium]|nr:peptide ABC transporter permease [Candidatus Margulisiibacteriota bacterium]
MGNNKLFILGAAILGLFILLAILAPVIAPYNPDEIVASQTLPPTLSHPFGTDDLGRDIFSRTLYGARISLSVGLAAMAIAILIGTLFGALAGYYGGAADAVIMRFVDVMLAFPSIFLILAIQAMLTPN